MPITRQDVNDDITAKITGKTLAKSLTQTEDGANRVLMMDYVDQGMPYKSYEALISQSGTDAPTVYIGKNDANLSITFNRNGVGNYSAILASGFVNGKTTVIPGSCSIETIFTAAFQNSSIIALRTFTNESGINVHYDDELNNTFFEIRIYN